MLTLADLRRRARSRLDDTVVPYLWSDTDLLDYINDTVRDASIRANLVVQDDIAIPFTQKVDLTWNSKYALSSGVLQVKSIYLDSLPSINLRQTSFRRQDAYSGSRPVFNGSPFAYALDQTQAGSGDDLGIFVRSVTFIGAPVKADTARISIIRLPALMADDFDVPEIDEIWHPYLISGITGFAYLKRDADTFDPKRSARDFSEFEDSFGPRLPAVVIRERQTDVPHEMIVG